MESFLYTTITIINFTNIQLFSLFHQNLRVSFLFTPYSLGFHHVSFISLPWFMGFPYWAVWGTSHGFPSWIPTILGLVTKPTATVTSHSVAICNNMANMVACPTSDYVVGISNTSSCIMLIVQSFVTKLTTRETVTIKKNFIPGLLNQPWRSPSSKFALTWRTNSLMSSLFYSSYGFLSLYMFLRCSFTFTFWEWRACFMLPRSPCPNFIFFIFLVVSKTIFVT